MSPLPCPNPGCGQDFAEMNNIEWVDKGPNHPVAGDLVMCAACGLAARFATNEQGELYLRRTTSAENAELRASEGWQQLRRYWREQSGIRLR